MREFGLKVEFKVKEGSGSVSHNISDSQFYQAIAYAWQFESVC